MTQTTNETETWPPVPGWPYAVSDRGRVRRTGSKAHARPPGNLLKPRLVCGKGYKTPYARVVLQDRPRRRCVFVHVLVLEAFVGPRPPSLQCNHINGDKLDNALRNLEWTTGSENQRHALRIGLRTATPRNVKLPIDQIPLIRSRHASGETTAALAREYCVDHSTIGLLIRRKTWANVP
jgi:hypothetical protein